MAEPIPLRMSVASIQRLIRSRAGASEAVIITDHAQERMEERSFTIDDVLTILRLGGVYCAPLRNEKGDWQADVERRMPGGRDAVAVTIVPHGQMLIVRTIMWRDER